MDYIVKQPYTAIVMLTNQCNMKCPFCYEQRRPERMSLDLAKDVMCFLHKADSQRAGFTFFGGEPMLEYETIIRPMIEWAKELPKPTRFAMTTNGTLFTEERLQYLHDNNVNFMLSMDGSKTSESCNRPLRSGRNGFDVTMQYVPRILELWPMQSFRSTVTPQNVQNLFEDILFFEGIGCRNLMIEPDLFQPWQDEAVTALMEQMSFYEAYLIDKIKAGERPLVLHELYVAFRNLAILTQCRNGGRRDRSPCDGCHKCGFGVLGSCSIDPTGDIYGCHHITPLNRDSIFYLGNVYDGIQEERVRTLVDAYDKSKIGNSQCASCGLDWICDGGCVPNNYQINGDFHATPDAYCYWKRATTDTAYRMSIELESNDIFRSIFTLGIERGW